jgi:hypothetical protein
VEQVPTRTRVRHKAAHPLRNSDEKTISSIPTVKRLARLRFPPRACLILAGYLLTVALGGMALYLWHAPLPPFPAFEIADGPLAAAAAGRAGSKASLEVCLRQVKVRELFKPSIPVPSESRLGKTTAQELASRLQFLGIVGSADDVAALVFIPNRGPGTFRAGDRVAEFTLKDVKPDRLVLGLGDEEATLKR